MYVKASDLHNDFLAIYFDEYYNLSDTKIIEIDPKYNPANLTLDGCDYNEWYKEKELRDLLLLEGD